MHDTQCDRHRLAALRFHLHRQPSEKGDLIQQLRPGATRHKSLGNYEFHMNFWPTKQVFKALPLFRDNRVHASR
jgi:hypothetical protein